MKSKTVNNMSYTGIVTLSQYIGSKKVELARIHNTGGVSLFNFLADCLAGNFTAVRKNWPSKIKILERIENNNAYEYTPVSRFIFLRTAPMIIENETTECRVRYSFLIPRDMLENLSNMPALGLGLYTTNAPELEDLDSFVAFCSLESALDLSNADLANSPLLVDWELVITNATRATIN